MTEKIDNIKAVQVMIDRDLHQQMIAKAALQNMKVSDAYAIAAKEWLTGKLERSPLYEQCMLRPDLFEAVLKNMKLVELFIVEYFETVNQNDVMAVRHQRLLRALVSEEYANGKLERKSLDKIG